MKRFLSFVLVVLLTPCAALAQECLFCGGDDICDACDGAGYQIVTLYGSDETVKIICTAGCDNGTCPDCVALCPLCGGDRICDTCGGAGYSMMSVYGSNEPIMIACSAGCNIGACPNCIVECTECGNDGLCDECGGLAYTTAKAYGSDDVVKIACMSEKCRQGFCAVCMPEIADRFAMVNAAEAEATPVPTPKPTAQPTHTPTPQPTRTPKPTPTQIPAGQASFGNGTKIADLALYSDYQFRLAKSDKGDVMFNDAPWYIFEPTSYSGSIYTFAEGYVDALVDSGNYVIDDSYSINSNYTWILRYTGCAWISSFDDVMLHDADINFSVDTSDQSIMIYLNPEITFFQ